MGQRKVRRVADDDNPCGLVLGQKRRGPLVCRFFCWSGVLFLLGRIFLRSAEGDGGLLGHWLQGRIQQG